MRGVLERGGDVGRGLRRGEGEVPGPLLGIVDHLGETTVRITPAGRRCAAVHGRREERVREADFVPTHAHDVCVFGGTEEIGLRVGVAARSTCTVGRVVAAASSNALRVRAGSRRMRAFNSPSRSSGAGRGSPGTRPGPSRSSARTISSAKSGFPSVASCTRTSVGRDSSAPVHIRTIFAMESTPRASTKTRSARVPRPPSMAIGSCSPTASRSVAMTPTGSVVNRRRANESADAEAPSSHCTSSTARTSGRSDASNFNAPSVAVETARRSAPRPGPPS